MNLIKNYCQNKRGGHFLEAILAVVISLLMCGTFFALINNKMNTTKTNMQMDTSGLGNITIPDWAK